LGSEFQGVRRRRDDKNDYLYDATFGWLFLYHQKESFRVGINLDFRF